MSASELKKSMQQYGKQKISEKEQINILYCILSDAKSKLEEENDVYNLLTDIQSRLKNENDLKRAIEQVNQFIIELETIDSSHTTIDYLKKHGFYRILYRNPKILGQELPENDILRQLLRNGFVGVGVSALIILLFASTAFFTAPFWFTALATGLFVGASTYLSGLLYGVVNDIFATHANLPYFLLGHQPQQTSLLRTNNKFAQGIAWGVAATFGPVILATILFTIVATITAFFAPIATFLLPMMMVAMPLIAIGAEFYARKKTSEYIENKWFYPLIGSNPYQVKGLNYMCPTKAERAAWCANSDRNLFGFTKVPLMGLGTLVGLIALSAVSPFLPATLFVSPVIAVAIPAAFAAISCASLLAAGGYMYINRNRQVDNRYRLEFDRDEIEPDLYLAEDMEYVQGVLARHNQQTKTNEYVRGNTSEYSYKFLFQSQHDNTEKGPHQELQDNRGFIFS